MKKSLSFNRYTELMRVFTAISAVAFVMHLPPVMAGQERAKPRSFISLTPGNNDTVGDKDLKYIRVSAVSLENTGRLGVNADVSSRQAAVLTNGLRTVRLKPVPTRYENTMLLLLEENLEEGEWRLEIPEGYFYSDIAVSEVSHVSGEPEYYATLPESGAWHKTGASWTEQPMFTIHDDDTIDGAIADSNPSDWMKGGYYSVLYPLLESLGLRGCLSMEGWRNGFTDNPPVLNRNGETSRRLQDEKGWEIMSHSMTARYYNNNWYVDGLDSDVARRILREGRWYGIRSNLTTSVYDAETERQYSVNSTLTAWEETPREWIKAYVSDYETGKLKMYSPVFPVDYQWGDWFRIADTLGIHGNAWVTCGPTSSHANVPLINAICPNGFESDGVTFYNLPPLGSTVTRMMTEGQQLPGYIGEEDADNRFRQDHYDFYISNINAAARAGAWIILGLHSYRPCWRNSLPGALVSEGGAYPDEWVWPMAQTDPVTGDLRPHPSLGIREWSEWYPCPGTRLHMLWQLLRHARDLGMLNVTSSEGFSRMGNKISSGYYHKGIPIGPDAGAGIEGTRDIYPHYVLGANGEEDYYCGVQVSAVTATYICEKDYYSVIGRLAKGERLYVVSVDGKVYDVESISQLQPGLYVINGRKVLIRR